MISDKRGKKLAVIYLIREFNPGVQIQGKIDNCTTVATGCYVLRYEDINYCYHAMRSQILGHTVFILRTTRLYKKRGGGVGVEERL